MTPKQRILTGDRPTGPLHLGHYFGKLENRLKLQNKGFEIFIIIADYQVLTDRLQTDDIEKNIYELVRDYIGIGLQPDKSLFFVQSKIPELTELTIIFSMLIGMNMVLRNPTVKEEVKSMGLENNYSLGMISYPVSQAADILMFNPHQVPVGEDQLPHIELAREIARKFNRLYGQTFQMPVPLLGSFPRLIGLDGDQKMSKSRNNAIFLSDDLEMIKKKIMSSATDSGCEIYYDPVEKPNISNLLKLYGLLAKQEIAQIEKKYKNKKYKEFKEGLIKVTNTFLDPIRKKREKVSLVEIKDILREGGKVAQKEAGTTIKRIKKAMKMLYGI